MNRASNRLTGILLLGVFAFFYCGNTLFLHTHNLGDVSIVHSHPYLPSGHHSHSSQTLDSIAGFNAALLSIALCEQPALSQPTEHTVILDYAPVECKSEITVSACQWRAPPQC